MKEKIESVAKYQESIKQSEVQDSRFNDDFESTVLPLIKDSNPDLTQKELDEIYSTVYKKAFEPTKENQFNPSFGRASQSLVQIYLNSKSKEKRFTGEKSRIKSFGGGKESSIDSSTTAEDIENMSDEEFDQSFNANKGKTSKLISSKKNKDEASETK